MNLSSRSLLPLACGLALFSATGQPTPAPTPAPTPSIRELPDGNVAIGEIVVDRAARAIRFPARVNMAEGFVEYFLVGAVGKTHESVLATDVQPSDLHVAMLLLGVKPAAAADPKQQPPANISDEWLAASPVPTGTPVSVTLAFKDSKGEAVKLPAERFLVLGEKEQRPVTGPGWIYTGSLLVEGAFLAQQEGSIIALIRDSGALVNNSLPEAVRDDAWLVAAKSVPAKGTGVTVEISLGKQAAAPAK